MGIDFSNLFTRPAAQHGSAKEQLGNLAGMLQRSGANAPAPAPAAAPAAAEETVETMSDLIRASDDVAVDTAQHASRSGGIRNMGIDDLRNLFARGGGAAEASSAGAAAISDDVARAAVSGASGSGGGSAMSAIRSMGIEDLAALLNPGGGAGRAAAAAAPVAAVADDAMVTAASLADDAAATVAKAGVMDDLLKAAGMLSKINPRG